MEETEYTLILNDDKEIQRESQKTVHVIVGFKFFIRETLIEHICNNLINNLDFESLFFIVSNIDSEMDSIPPFTEPRRDCMGSMIDMLRHTFFGAPHGVNEAQTDYSNFQKLLILLSNRGRQLLSAKTCCVNTSDANAVLNFINDSKYMAYNPGMAAFKKQLEQFINTTVAAPSTRFN